MFLNYLRIAVDGLLDIYDLTVEPLRVDSERHLPIRTLREDFNPQRTLELSRHEHQERELLYHVVVARHSTDTVVCCHRERVISRCPWRGNPAQCGGAVVVVGEGSASGSVNSGIGRPSMVVTVNEPNVPSVKAV
jgi:hypothetical protein